MRLTAILCKQHIGRMFRRHWIVQGKRTLRKNVLEEYLKSKNINVEDANKFVEVVHDKPKYEFVGYFDHPLPEDESHPLWKDKPCYVALEDRVLLQGLPQAQLLTKSVHVSDVLPEDIEKSAKRGAPEAVHKLAQKAIMYANVYDSDQKKLPRKIDPVRPAHKFARDYGITDERKNLILNNKLLGIIERHSEENSVDRLAVVDANIVATYENGSDLIRVESPSNTLLTTLAPLQPVVKDIDFTAGIELPDVYPMKYTISLIKKNIYEIENFYPLCNTVQAYHPHTSYLLFNKSEVINLHRSPVTDTQLKGRSLLHCFSIAKAYAKLLNEDDAGDLQTPITIQCVQSDGCNFHFGIFQLNTLNLKETDGIKNIWYTMPGLPLFKFCGYESAIPKLTEYNPQVLDYLYAFYNNK